MWNIIDTQDAYANKNKREMDWLDRFGDNRQNNILLLSTSYYTNLNFVRQSRRYFNVISCQYLLYFLFLKAYTIITLNMGLIIDK